MVWYVYIFLGLTAGGIQTQMWFGSNGVAGSWEMRVKVGALTLRLCGLNA